MKKYAKYGIIYIKNPCKIRLMFLCDESNFKDKLITMWNVCISCRDAMHSYPTNR